MRYRVIWQDREIGGYGRKKNITKTVTAPVVRHISGASLNFRPNELELAEAVCDALNKRRVSMGQKGDDSTTPTITDKDAKHVLREVGYI